MLIPPFLAERPIPALMTPRLDIVWLDMEADAQQLRETLQQYPYSRYLVCRGKLDDLQGVVQGRGLLAGVLAGEPLKLGQIPNGGEQFALEGYQFEVVSMDGHRIQQVRVRYGGAEGSRHA